MSSTISKITYRYMLETDDCEYCDRSVYAFNYNDAMVQVTEYYRDSEIRSIKIEVSDQM